MIEQKNIDEALRRLIDVYNPLTVYLFDQSPDVAFVIVVEGSWQKPQKRGIAGKYALWGLEIPKDILVFTKDEFEKHVDDATNLVHAIKNEGKVLYAEAS